jgi:protein transport protein SEC24
VLQVYLQCALLYTTTDGARRVRISTLALPVSDQMGAVFKGADLDSQLANMTRQVRARLVMAVAVVSAGHVLANWTVFLGS